MPNYLDKEHPAEISKLLNTLTGRTEWPTWLLIIGFYSAWIGVIGFSSVLGPVWSVGVLLPLIVLWMSLQHECIHGHPTRWPALNKALVYLPFAIWYPYDVYRETHLAHHVNETLTMPGLDPESRYILNTEWDRAPRVMQLLSWMNKTVAGRLIVGVPLALASLMFLELPQAIKRRDSIALAWGVHIVWVTLILWMVQRYSAISAWKYVVFVSVPALAIGMIRSFYEHRPSEHSEHRTVINESRGVLSWLFLNLNLHLVHHDLPKLPWYYLPTVYRARRLAWIARSNAYVVSNYRQLIFDHFIKPVDSPVYPLPVLRNVEVSSMQYDKAVVINRLTAMI